jgi:hypothetical protein
MDRDTLKTGLWLIGGVIIPLLVIAYIMMTL